MAINMDEQQLHERVKTTYWEINDKWMKFHVHLLFICALVAAVAEIVVSFFIIYSGSINCTIEEYWFKYIIIPVFMSLCIAITEYFVFKSKSITKIKKQYFISFLFSLFAFVLSLAHSGFVAVVVCAIVPILMTIMYEDRILTTCVAVFCAVAQWVSGVVTFWDPDKVLDQWYYINLFILMAGTFCIWLTSCYMIGFMKMKREIIISNEIERYVLKEKINVDGLTQVGNKLALTKMLESISDGTSAANYLAMVDVDNFKQINDTYGHIFGDDVLRCIGEGMRNIAIESFAFRYGGDEFCLIFKEESLEEILVAVKGLQKHLKDNMKFDNEDETVYLSIGITQYSTDKTSSEILSQADEALYISKKHRGGHISMYRANDKGKSDDLDDTIPEEVTANSEKE